MNNKPLLIIVIIFLVCAFGCTKKIKNQDDNLCNNIPIQLDAINISNVKSDDGKLCGVYYSIKTSFPSTEIYSFYKKYLEENGFEQVVPKNIDLNTINKWFVFITEKPIGAQLDAYWVNKKNNYFVWLTLSYRWIHNENNNEQIVNFRIVSMMHEDILKGIDMLEIRKIVGDKVLKSEGMSEGDDNEMLYPKSRLTRQSENSSGYYLEAVAEEDYPSLNILNFYKSLFQKRDCELIEIKSPLWNSQNWREGKFAGIGERKIFKYAAFQDAFWRNKKENYLIWLHCEVFWKDQKEKESGHLASQKIILKKVHSSQSLLSNLNDFDPNKIFSDVW